MVNIDHPSVAKEHACIEVTHQKAYLKHISSNRMTLLNGRALQNKDKRPYVTRRLRNRDVLRFGTCETEYVFKDNLDD